MKVIMVPGINGSGPDHWQSRWEADFGERATRIAPASWDEPDIDDWCAALDAAAGSGPTAELLVIAHSLGCHAAAEWLSRNPNRVAGVFLVAPPDTAAANFPASAAPSFVPLTRGPIGVPGLMLYSRNDPYCAPEQARQYAERWQVASVDVGALGHINVDAGLEAWLDGRNLLTAFIAGRGVRSVLVACSIQIDAPREGRAATRVKWLLRQLPAEARDSLRIEAALAGGRGASTAQLLGTLRKKPDNLLPADGRDIRGFKVVMEMPIGSKRAATPGGLIKSVQDIPNLFYAEVVQNLHPWSAKPPQLSTQSD